MTKSLWWNLFEVAINMYQTGAMLFFIHAILVPRADRKLRKSFTLSFWALGSSLLSMHYFGLIPQWLPNIVASIMIFMIYACFFFRGSPYSKALWCVIFFTAYGSISTALYTAALKMPSVTPELLNGHTNTRLIHVLTANLMLPPMIIFLKRVSKRLWEDALDRYVVIGTIIVLVLNVVIMFCLLDFAAVTPDDTQPPYLLVIIAFGILATSSLILWMFHHINKQNRDVIELRAHQQRMEMELKHAEESLQIDEALRRWRHDHHHQLHQIMSYIDNEDYDALQRYIVDVDDEFRHITARVETGNKAMDAIINAKIAIAQSQGVVLISQMMLPAELPVSENDLTIVMGNLLDNAIEASSRLLDPNQKQVFVRARIQQGTFSIEVRNHYIMDMEMRKGRFSNTSKADDGKPHGMGIHIIDLVAQKYGGYVNRRDDSGEYAAQILFPLGH